MQKVIVLERICLLVKRILEVVHVSSIDGGSGDTVKHTHTHTRLLLQHSTRTSTGRHRHDTHAHAQNKHSRPASTVCPGVRGRHYSTQYARADSDSRPGRLAATLWGTIRDRDYGGRHQSGGTRCAKNLYPHRETQWNCPSGGCYRSGC